MSNTKFSPRDQKKTMGKSKCNGGHSIFGEQNLWDQPPTADRGVAASLPSEMYRDGPHTKIRTWPHTAAPGWCPLLAGNGSGAGPCSRLAILPTGLPEFGAAVAEWRARPRAARLFFTKMTRFQNFRLRRAARRLAAPFNSKRCGRGGGSTALAALFLLVRFGRNLCLAIREMST